MHGNFQRDLCKLRLTTARTNVKVLTDCHGTMSNGGNIRLKFTGFRSWSTFQSESYSSSHNNESNFHVYLNATFDELNL
eukprot:TRINITY_DN11774_c0_g1_i1.p1 TRINITY_DN11774_c0_g1~~TRINITY_DN11774_c0_g1_i1.p1  ORF type:complete len:79 (-),score=3.53 TRINITY_DN11774_c0_g1_i1:102-338(-)